MKKQATFFFNGEVHTEKEIDKIIHEICRIKEIDDNDFRRKLKRIFMKANNITKYKKDLSFLYGEKINKENYEHMNKLFDIYIHFNPKDRQIQKIDQKWSKIKYHIIIINDKIFFIFQYFNI